MHVTGSLLVKTVISYFPNNPVKVVTRYKVGPDVVAVGLTSGNAYAVKGKSTLKYAWYPGVPVKSVDHAGVLMAYPNNPIWPGTPIRVRYHLDFDSLLGGAVSGSTIDFPQDSIIGSCTPIAQVCN